ncbi:hypothetical protein GC105_05920 [Alkalibaculum sp. M08DMB]|uniref:Cell wall-active antibiotics response protein n=1 Tax=Alkalibaculum sporogenes TaxID=2655001 RepID=A0A6A7K746_9FIRM|nr:cell wall-active antibiotics response protein LiaF [Alkalibaculum sporogenes]MPW25319.1 hypothetical protein [Alkalibaculum sporogenes]
MSRSKGNWIFGLLIIFLGVLLFFNNLGFTDIDLSNLFSTYWPVVFILLGINFLLNRGSTGETISGLVFILIGALLLGNRTGLLNIDYLRFVNLFWPIIIIIIGFTFIFGHKGNGKTNFAIMGAIERKTQPWILKSSSFIAFWGGIDLDLTLAEIPNGETIVDLSAIMGGIDIIVPDDISIECHGTAILGGVELLDKSTGGIFASTSSSQNDTKDSNKVVKFYCRAIMGGIEIKQKKRIS